MPLAAAQVVDALATRLSGTTPAGTRVYTSRAWPLSDAALPAWRVVAADESLTPQTVDGDELQHSLSIELQGYAKALADLDDSLHALASAALTTVFNPAGGPDALSALLAQVSITAQRIERAMRGEGEATLGLVTLTLRAEFHTRASAPDVFI